jgi:hypothetical protein
LLSATDVETRLRVLDEAIALAPTTLWRESGAIPEQAFETHPAPDGSDRPTVGVVLIYPTVDDRIGMQPFFHSTGITGPGGLVVWDGITHSEWIGVGNVLVEVVMPGGGAFGGRSPSPAEEGYPDRIRDALEASP